MDESPHSTLLCHYSPYSQYRSNDRQKTLLAPRQCWDRCLSPSQTIPPTQRDRSWKAIRQIHVLKRLRGKPGPQPGESRFLALRFPTDWRGSQGMNRALVCVNKEARPNPIDTSPMTSKSAPEITKPQARVPMRTRRIFDDRLFALHSLALLPGGRKGRSRGWDFRDVVHNSHRYSYIQRAVQHDHQH